MKSLKIYVPFHVAKIIDDLSICGYRYVLATLDGLLCLKENGYNTIIEYCAKCTVPNGFNLADELLVDWFIRENPAVDDIPVQGVSNPMLFNHICSELCVQFVHVYVREQFANHLNAKYLSNGAVNIAASYKYEED